MLAALALLAGLAMFTFAGSIPTSYQANATLVLQQFTDDSNIAPLLGLSSTVVAQNERGAPYLLDGDTGLTAIAGNVAGKLTVLTPTTIKHSVNISDSTDVHTILGRIYANADLHTLSITAHARSAALAAALATDFAGELVTYRRASLDLLFQSSRERLQQSLHATGDARLSKANQATATLRLTRLNQLQSIERQRLQFGTAAVAPHHRLGPYVLRDSLLAALLVPLMALLASLLGTGSPPRPAPVRVRASAV
jgi:hypothetical protein